MLFWAQSKKARPRLCPPGYCHFFAGLDSLCIPKTAHVSPFPRSFRSETEAFRGVAMFSFRPEDLGECIECVCFTMRRWQCRVKCGSYWAFKWCIISVSRWVMARRKALTPLYLLSERGPHREELRDWRSGLEEKQGVRSADRGISWSHETRDEWDWRWMNADSHENSLFWKIKTKPIFVLKVFKITSVLWILQIFFYLKCNILNQDML